MSQLGRRKNFTVVVHLAIADVSQFRAMRYIRSERDMELEAGYMTLLF
jgi:hypothetical protein